MRRFERATLSTYFREYYASIFFDSVISQSKDQPICWLVNQPVGRSGCSLSRDSASQLIYQLIHQLSDINSF